MASVGKDRNGRKRILFVAEDGSRKTVRLGKASQKQAEAFKLKMENLIADRLRGGIDPETARWIAELPDDMHAKLAAVGLVEPRAQQAAAGGLTVGALCEQYIGGRDDVRKSTRTVYELTRRNLVDFFGPDKPIRDITPYDAEQWRRYLAREGLSEATARRRAGVAKQILRTAVKRRILADNPFAGLKSTAIGNESRLYFVSRQDAQRVLDACPDSQWRLIFALARFGGLRTPSETLALKWTDVDWARSRVLVHSCKTEHFEGKESRVIPMFPELLPPPARSLRRSGAGDGVRDYPIPAGQHESPNTTASNHPASRLESVAEALSELPKHERDGACRELPPACRCFVDREF